MTDATDHRNYPFSSHPNPSARRFKRSKAIRVPLTPQTLYQNAGRHVGTTSSFSIRHNKLAACFAKRKMINRVPEDLALRARNGKVGDVLPTTVTCPQP